MNSAVFKNPTSVREHLVVMRDRLQEMLNARLARPWAAPSAYLPAESDIAALNSAIVMLDQAEESRRG